MQSINQLQNKVEALTAPGLITGGNSLETYSLQISSKVNHKNHSTGSVEHYSHSQGSVEH